jgi:phosphatidylinositol kinase/protein kinase (PI-3  family)
MLATLAPMHAMMEAGPKTMREVAFQHAFGRELADAKERCLKFQSTGNISHLNRAWDQYSNVFRNMNKTLGGVRGWDNEGHFNHHQSRHPHSHHPHSHHHPP